MKLKCGWWLQSNWTSSRENKKYLKPPPSTGFLMFFGDSFKNEDLKFVSSPYPLPVTTMNHILTWALLENSWSGNILNATSTLSNRDQQPSSNRGQVPKHTFHSQLLDIPSVPLDQGHGTFDDSMIRWWRRRRWLEFPDVYRSGAQQGFFVEDLRNANTCCCKGKKIPPQYFEVSASASARRSFLWIRRIESLNPLGHPGPIEPAANIQPEEKLHMFFFIQLMRSYLCGWSSHHNKHSRANSFPFRNSLPGRPWRVDHFCKIAWKLEYGE